MSRFHLLEILKHEEVAEDAIEIALKVPADLSAEFTARPGQHIVLRASIDGEEQRRTYSLTSAAGELPLRICPRVHEHGVFSRHLARDYALGDRIEALSPKGSLFVELQDAAPRHCVGFAAGCGITPIFSLVSSLLRDEPESRFTLVFGNRNMARAMLLEDLLALKDRYKGRLALTMLMSREPGDTELLNGRIDKHWIERTAGKLFPLDAKAFYLCGPGTMIGEVRDSLLDLGVDSTKIHVEHFSRDTLDVAEDQASANIERRDEQVEVQVLQAGRRRSFLMQSGAQTILEAGLESGLELPYSCTGGVCCTCRAQLLEGQVEMMENYALEPDEVEEGGILVCQSLPLSNQVIISYDGG